MQTLKLEVGKTYRSRKGEEVRIVEKNRDGKYPYKGDNGHLYTESGRFLFYAEESPYDLIEEVPSETTRHTFKIPDDVKEVTIEQVGNRIVVEMVPEEAKEPKPGDVMINEYDSVYIFKEDVGNGIHEHYALLGENGRFAIEAMCHPGRPATPEEAKPLFDAFKKAGKRWNPETMQVEDVPEKEVKNGILKGYKIGKAISIHTHINDPESWFVTISALQIFGQSLCKKDCTEAEIARYVSVMLHKKLNIVNELIKDVVPFT